MENRGKLLSFNLELEEFNGFGMKSMSENLGRKTGMSALTDHIRINPNPSKYSDQEAFKKYGARKVMYNDIMDPKTPMFKNVDSEFLR